MDMKSMWNPEHCQANTGGYFERPWLSLNQIQMGFIQDDYRLYILVE